MAAHTRRLGTIIVGAASAALLSLAGCATGAPGESDVAVLRSDATDRTRSSSEALTGEGLPSLALTTLNGEPVDLTALAGDGIPAVLNLWYRACRPCRQEMPEFEAVHQQLAGRVRFVGLNVQDSASSAAEFANDVGVTYEILLDPSGTAPGKLGATAMPSTIVVDADGTVAAIYVGKLDADGLRALLDEVLV